jgi:YggT family protein
VSIREILCWLLTAYNLVLLARIIWSWFPVPHSGIGRTIFDLIYDLTEPVLGLVRGLIPAIRMGAMGFDLSPILVFIVLNVLQAILGCGFGL